MRNIFLEVLPAYTELCPYTKHPPPAKFTEPAALGGSITITATQPSRYDSAASPAPRGRNPFPQHRLKWIFTRARSVHDLALLNALRHGLR